MKKLDHILHLDEFYKYGVAIFLFVLGFYFICSYLFFVIYILYIKKQINIVFLGCIVFVLSLCYALLTDFKEIEIQQNLNITMIDSYEDYDRYTLKYSRYKFHMYGQKNQYQIGDVLYVKAQVTPYRSQSVPYGFDAKNYYLSFGVYGKLDVKELEYVGHQFHLFEFREKLKNNIRELKSSSYVEAFIFGEKIKDEQTKDFYKNFDILYLFTVSGLHIFILMLGLKKLLYMFNLDDKFQQGTLFLFYLIIGYLNTFSFAVLRLLLFFIIKQINKKYEVNMQNLDMLFLTFLVLIIYNIGFIYHQGFILTFVILIGLELIHPLLQGYQGLVQKLMMSLAISIMIIPFYNDIYILQILLLPMIIILVTMILYPFSILTFILPAVDQMYRYLLDWFEKMIFWISNFQIHFFIPKFDLLQSVVYYLLLIGICFSKSFIDIFKRTLLSMLIILLLSVFRINQQMESITFLDVGQGDTAIVNTNNCKMAIDAFDGLPTYLKDQGIYELDYLILTHSHEDHMKEAFQVMKDIKVNEVIVSYYDDRYPFYNQNVLKLKANDKIKCGSINIDFLGPIKDYENENNVSLVFQMKYDGQIFLFTGDIEENAEYDLVEKYGHQLKSDVLKAPHHGSITSSTELFLSIVKPRVVVISLSMSNKYGFPAEEVVKRYEKMSCLIFRTDEQGTITYQAKRRKEKWHTHLSI